MQKDLSPWVRCLDGVVWLKNRRSKISWKGPFNYLYDSLHVVFLLQLKFWFQLTLLNEIRSFLISSQLRLQQRLRLQQKEKNFTFYRANVIFCKRKILRKITFLSRVKFIYSIATVAEPHYFYAVAGKKLHAFPSSGPALPSTQYTCKNVVNISKEAYDYFVCFTLVLWNFYCTTAYSNYTNGCFLVFASVSDYTVS
jgi:hypothetical protein